MNLKKLWPELSKNINELNDYSTKYPVELKHKKVEDLNLKGVIFIGATFSDVEWNNVLAKKAELSKTTFQRCKFIGGGWEEAVLTDVIFENCEFIDTSLNGSKMINVQFKDCKIDHTSIGYLSGEKVVFKNCEWDTGVGGVSSCQFEFYNCRISGVMFMGMKNNATLLIDGGVLDDLDFGKSHFSNIVLKNVKQGAGGIKFNDLSAKSIVVENVDMTHGTAMARSTIGSVTISGGRFGTSFGHAKIGSISIRDAELTYMEFSEVNLPKVTITNCSLYDTAFYDGFIEELAVYNSKIDIVIGENFKADTVVWDNVTLDGKIDFTDAHIKDFQPSRITRGPNLNLITTGSNLKF